MPLFSRRRSEAPPRVVVNPPVLPSPVHPSSAPLVPWETGDIVPNRMSVSTTTSTLGRSSTSSGSRPSEAEEYAELCRPAFEILSDYMENPVGTLGVSRLVAVDINRKSLPMSNRRLLMMTLDLVDEIQYRQTQSPSSKRVWHRVNDKPREQARVQFSNMSPTGILSVVRNTHAEIEARFPSIMSNNTSAAIIEMEDIPPPTPISPSQPGYSGGTSTLPQPRLSVLPPPPPSPLQSRPAGNTSTVPRFRQSALPPPPLPPPPPPRRDNDDGLCVVCCDSRANTLLVNCRHLSMCGECADAIMLEPDPRCPVCRTEVGDPAVSVIRVFLT